MGGMDGIVAEFLAESVENLDRLDQDLVSLEKNPSDREIYAGIFRTIHTIKGTCGFLAFQKLEALTHVGESVLSRLRDGTLDLRPEITTDLLAMIDGVRAILAHIEADGSEGNEEYSDLIASLQAYEAEPEGGADSEKPTPKKAAAKKKSTPQKKSTAAKSKTAAAKTPVQPKVPKKAAAKEAQPTTDEPPEAETGADPLELATAPVTADSHIRVDVRVLDNLMNLVGELVLARNQLVQHISGSPDTRLANTAQRLDGVTGELQDAVMRTRMQPISSIWKKLPRFVRDLALSFGKEVEIKMEGEDTDLDKSVIEAIKGSLLHLVRNAVDHGIEDPDIRESNGKPRAGTLRLRAHHEGGNVIIEVRDDGAGLNHERIVTRAVKAGLVSEADVARLSPSEIERFVFQAGFSTASKVTNVSGRGVGLDVVRANVESLGGSIDLMSEPGASTTIRVKIPLTLAIVSVLLVAAGDNRIAIPQVSVVELVRLEGDGADLGIEDVNGVPVCRLRGKLLPLVYLNRELGVDDQREAGSAAYIVVLQGDDRQFGLVVDTIEDSQEIVVKPLGKLLSGLPFAGATILGDGQIALILDVYRLGLKAGVVSETRARTISAQISTAVEERKHRARLVCLRGKDDERMAVEFDHVSRLESFPRSSIEVVGRRQVVQYGDEILPLIDLQQSLPERRSKSRTSSGPVELNTVPVVVCTINGRLVGLVVNQIADIVEEGVRARRPASREGVRACTVIGDRVTEILDIETVVRLADPEFFDRTTETES